MFLNDRPILVLAPHTDDGELGCGATISKLTSLGHQVHYVAFCSCDESLPKEFELGSLRRELLDATEVLGIPAENVTVHSFTVRKLSYSRQDILEELVKLNRTLNPQLVFCPTVDDLHQDHAVVAQEALRAFKTKTVLGYEIPWNNIEFHANYLVTVNERDLETKISALRMYTSQKHRPYFSERFLRAHAHSRGVTIGAEYAEAFTLYRAVY
ncbi:PIG-L deacetylase family protein [Pseudomonas shirazensis]|uniref:PIG-L deacetylase family protein n=1 Tax=Pseudomonas shirazensis TaxID=2745494 RepID=UPI00192DFD0B|nr:PIG-L family deacetylase [Pseudomonas shirazensis]